MNRRLEPFERLSREELQDVSRNSARLRLEGFDEICIYEAEAIRSDGFKDNYIDAELTPQAREALAHRRLVGWHRLWVFDRSTGDLRAL